MLKSFNTLVTVALLILLGFFGAPSPIQAATGDMLRSIFVNPIPSCGYFSAGVAFDGSELLISCVFSNVITRVSPVDGSNLGSLTIDGISASEGITAMSWDAQNGRLWVGSATVIPQKVYTVTLDRVRQRGTATFKFTHTQGGGESWIDGLAFDPTDGTVWLGPDGQTRVYHYTQAGTLLGSFSVEGIARFGKSGIVVGSPTKLYVANDGGSQIFSVNKDGTSPALFANVPAGKRVEDLECDNVTFAPKSVIWSKYSFDNYELNAFEVPDGECLVGAGGKVLNVPLFKQGVAPYNDNNPSWEGLEYDHGATQRLTGNPLWCGTTIAQCGCALTSAAMVLSFFGVTRGADGRTTDPATLNDYFKLDRKCTPRGVCFSRGYSDGNVVWSAVDQYSRDAFRRFGTQMIKSQSARWNSETVRQDILSESPVILQQPGHLIVATGILGDLARPTTFTINDPLFNRSRLNDSAYGNEALSIVRYFRVASDFSRIVVAAIAPAQVMITDTNGRRTGLEPISSAILQEIPDSSYVFNSALTDDTGVNPPPPAGAGVFLASVDTPQTGFYQIEVISPLDTDYSFGIYPYNRDADLDLQVFEARAIASERHRYTFLYDPKPGEKTLALQVITDIKPGSDPNSVNPKSKGVIPVAILSTDTFDATMVEPLSVKFGTSGALETHRKGHIEDVNGDGKTDMVLHFRMQETGIEAGDIQVCLKGNTTEGLDIVGCDTISTVP